MHLSMSIDPMNTCFGPSRSTELSVSRRDFLRRAGGGFGMLALASLLDGAGLLAPAASRTEGTPVNPLAPRPPHMPARARSVIFLFMSGGPSHVDLFDPKPEL